LILLDSSGLFASIDDSEPMHGAARAALEADPGPFVLSPFALAELDYLLIRELGVDFELSLLDQVATGAFQLAAFDESDIAEAMKVIETYRDLRIGLADASLVVLSGKLQTEDVLTLDERHFRALRSPRARPFRILPADA
jgi:predicted nucleic acid-binding protein